MKKDNRCVDCGTLIWCVSKRCKPCFIKGKTSRNKIKIADKRVTKETRKKMSNAHIREKNPRWKGGKFQTDANYIYLLNPNHPNCNNMGYVPEHRLIMENHLGRYLTPEELVHHLDGDRTNNKIENLHLFKSIGGHLKYHSFLRICVKEVMAL